MPPPKLQFNSILLPCLVLLVFWARPTAAFGAGNIASMSKIEGSNWRHGDIEDTLLTLLISATSGKKFSKMDVKRVYFGNWLRDYSQAVDVGTVKMVSADAIRILLWIFGFLSFGYGTKEFEVTRDRLGCYRPEEHIDNPKDYADNIDARQYDRRLRGPVDEQRELAVDERNGLKSYIASEDLGIVTSAGMVRNLFLQCIDLGRRSGGRGPDFYEALRLLGTALHCLEDYSAHSNYTELALIELGERNVFPHVGQSAQFNVAGTRGPVYPIVTGTFGGVDFLHSVMGEMSDKATQSEIQELEGAISDADRNKNKSMIKDLLAKLPDGVFGGKDEASKADELENNANAAAMENMTITPTEPEAFTEQMEGLVKQIYPIMEFHDEIMQGISEFIEKLPIIPDIIEQLQEQVNVFVFSLLAPYILPIIQQVKAELETGSSEVIQSSRDKQHIVFQDVYCTDPTHSMLSKDHFSNVLNEPAGRIASEVLKWVVPQIVECWDDEGVDAQRTVNRIVNGVFHHPALHQYGDDGAAQGRTIMFRTVENWWNELSERAKNDLRDKLSRDGVQSGRNHKAGVKDKGHGCCKPIGMANDFSGLIGGGKKGKKGNDPYQKVGNEAGKMASEAVGGGAMGGLVGGLVSGLGGSLLGDAFGGAEKKKEKKKDKYGDDGSYTQSYSEEGHHKKTSRDDSERYGQAQYEQTQYPSGGRREEYSRHERDERGGTYGYQQKVETSGYGGSGGYERHEQRRYETSEQWQSEDRREGFDSKGKYYDKKEKKHGKKDKYGNKSEDEDEDTEDSYEKRKKKEQKKREKEEKKKYKKRGDDDDSDDGGYKRRGSGEYKRRGSDEYKRKSKEHKRRSPSPKRRGSGDYSRESGGASYGKERGYGGQQGYSGGGGYESQQYGAGGMPGGFESGQYQQGGGGYEGDYGRQGGAEYGERREEYGSGYQQGGYGGRGGDDGYERRY